MNREWLPRNHGYWDRKCNSSSCLCVVCTESDHKCCSQQPWVAPVYSHLYHKEMRKWKKHLTMSPLKKNLQLYRWANTQYKLTLKLLRDIFLWLMSNTQTLYSAVVSSPVHTIFTFTYLNLKINYHIQYENIFWPTSTSNLFPITTVYYLLSLPNNLRSTIKLKENIKEYAPWCCQATLPTPTQHKDNSTRCKKNMPGILSKSKWHSV